MQKKKKKSKQLFSKNDVGFKWLQEELAKAENSLAIYLKQILTVQTGAPSNASGRERQVEGHENNLKVNVSPGRQPQPQESTHCTPDAPG